MNIPRFIELLNQQNITYSATETSIYNLYKKKNTFDIEIYLLHFDNDIKYIQKILKPYTYTYPFTPHWYIFQSNYIYVDVLNVHQPIDSMWTNGTHLFQYPLHSFIYNCKGPYCTIHTKYNIYLPIVCIAFLIYIYK